jgi:hypothetical protein
MGSRVQTEEGGGSGELAGRKLLSKLPATFACAVLALQALPTSVRCRRVRPAESSPFLSKSKPVGVNQSPAWCSFPVCARLLRVVGWTEGGDLMPTVTRDKTKDELYREAKRLDIKGRSKMTKGLLKAAIARRRSS